MLRVDRTLPAHSESRHFEGFSSERGVGFGVDAKFTSESVGVVGDRVCFGWSEPGEHCSGRVARHFGGPSWVLARYFRFPF